MTQDDVDKFLKIADGYIALVHKFTDKKHFASITEMFYQFSELLMRATEVYLKMNKWDIKGFNNFIYELDMAYCFYRDMTFTCNPQIDANIELVVQNINELEKYFDETYLNSKRD